jgi:hypothetical protein
LKTAPGRLPSASDAIHHLALDSAREAFAGSPEANALLGREYRKPFVVPAESEI